METVWVQLIKRKEFVTEQQKSTVKLEKLWYKYTSGHEIKLF